MYKLIDTVDNVLTIALCGNKIILKQGVDYKNNELKLYSIIQGQMKEEALISKDVFNLGVQNESTIWIVVTNNNTGEYYNYNILTQRLHRTEYVYSYSDNYNDIIIGTKTTDKTTMAGLNCKSGKVLWKTEDISTRFSQGKNNFICTTDSSTILKSIDKKTGKDLWICGIEKIREQLFPQSEEIMGFRKIYGHWKGNIIISLSNYSILLIDNETGAITYHWKNDDFTKKPLFSNSCNYFVPEENKLISLSDSIYWEIDLSTKEIITHELEEMFKAQKLKAIHLGRAVVHGTDLIFPSDKATVGEKGQTVYNNSIVILDRINLTIKWKYRFYSPDAECGGYFGQVEVDENRIYVRTNTNKLYIFEKE